jgi:iron complex outermembrane receptor protein
MLFVASGIGGQERLIMSFRLLPALSALALGVSSAFAQSEVGPPPTAPQIAALAPVVVTASRYEQPLSEAGVLISIINRQQLLESGASNVIEALDRSPGVSVRRLYGQMGADASVDIGFLGESGAKNVLVLIDGFRVNNIDDESVRFTQLPISAIDRVEVRGAGAGVLYGDRAMGGVINIVTRQDLANEVSVAGGSFGYHKVDGYFSSSLNGLRLSLSAMDARSDGYRDRSRIEQQSARIALRSAGQGPASWGLQVRLFHEDAQLPGGITIAQFIANPRAARNPADQGRREGGQASLEFRRALGSSVRFLFLGGYEFSKNFADMQSFLPWSTAVSTRESSKLFAQPAFIWEMANGTSARAGADILLAQADVNGGNQVSQDSVAAYLTTETRLTPTSSISMGARRQGLANHFQINSAAAQDSDRKVLSAYSLGWSGRLSDRDVLRAGLVSGFRFPTTDELYYFNSLSFVPTRIHTGVGPMTSREFFLLAERRGKSAMYSASFRGVRTDGEIGFSSSAGCTPVLAGESCNTNLYDTQRAIVTLSGRWVLDAMTSASVSLDWVDSEIKSGANSGFRIPYVPQNVARAGVDRRLVPGLRLLGYVHYRTAMYQNDYFNNLADRGYEIPGRTLFDLGLIGQSGKNLQWGLWARNLTDKRYYDFGRDGSNAWGGVYPGDGRSYQLSVTGRF